MLRLQDSAVVGRGTLWGGMAMQSGLVTRDREARGDYPPGYAPAQDTVSRNPQLSAGMGIPTPPIPGLSRNHSADRWVSSSPHGSDGQDLGLGSGLGFSLFSPSSKPAAYDTNRETFFPPSRVDPQGTELDHFGQGFDTLTGGGTGGGGKVSELPAFFRCVV